MPQNNQCPVCHGNRVVESSRTGMVQVCPLCNGTGRADPPVNRAPKTYVFGNASEFTLAAGTPGAVQAQNMIIDGQYDFELVFLVATSTGTFQSRIADNVPRNWESAGIWINNANRWGTAQRPFPVVARVIFHARDVLTGEFRDTSNASNTLQACFVGYDLQPV